MLKYLIVGAGGCGGSIGAFLADSGKDVTFIARGAHLEAMKSNGLYLENTCRGNFRVCPVKVYSESEYLDVLERCPKLKPDVVFICVKGYSLTPLIPFLQKLAEEQVVFVPILNIYGTGASLQQNLSPALVTDGCMYIAAEIKSPGVILQRGAIFKVVFGVRQPQEYQPVLQAVHEDLKQAGIYSVLSENIQKDALMKFSLISPMASTGVYYDVRMGEVQKEGEIRETFKELVGEIQLLAMAMGVVLPENLVEINLKLIDDLKPDASASMQRDIWQGKPSEVDGLVFEVIRKAKMLEVDVPVYERIAQKLKQL